MNAFRLPKLANRLMEDRTSAQSLMTVPMPPRQEFISEPIKPDRATGDATAMAQGVPGLPAGFTWRDRHYTIVELLESWKQSEPCDHGSGERYYRTQYYRIRTDSGETMTLYAVRHVKHGENPKRRWRLYAIRHSDRTDSTTKTRNER